MLDLILNRNGSEEDPGSPISRLVFEQVLFKLSGIEKREIDRYFYLNGKLGMSIEIDTDEGLFFENIYLAVPSANIPEAYQYGLALAKHLASELGLKIFNPLEGHHLVLESLPSLEELSIK